MKNWILLMVIMAISGASQSQTVNLTAFDMIDASGNVDIELYKGEPRAEVNMIEGDLDDLVLKSTKGSLVIKFKEKKWGWNKSKAKIKLYTNSLKEVELSAGANLESSVAFTEDQVDIEVSSGAAVRLNIDAETTKSEVSSGGSIKLEGESDKLDVEVSSGGSFSGKLLQSKVVTAEASSGGSAKVWATEKLNAETSSGGSIQYKGDPSDTDLDADKWSGGSIRKI